MPQFRLLALAAASRYAPKPNGSALTYGIVGAIVFGAAAAFVGWFYGIDLSRHLALSTGGLVIAFISGVVFRKSRNRRRHEAFATEHAKARAEGV